MKRSELKEFIKEEILTSLKEATIETSPQNLSKVKSQAKDDDIIKVVEDKEDNWADYTDIGQFYLEGFGKEHTLDDNQLENLGKKIVDQLYKGDVGKAYDDIVGRFRNKPKDIKENEDDDTEKDAVKAAKSARGKHKKLDIAVKALKDITTEMKSIAREYSKADGIEKEKIKDKLKTKTAKKKELESLVAKLEKDVV